MNETAEIRTSGSPFTGINDRSLIHPNPNGRSIILLGSKMKRILIPASVILGILAICLLPHASHRTSAYPENLWTNGGQFGEPSKTQALLDWNRTEYGVLWAWLVYDSCTS